MLHGVLVKINHILFLLGAAIILIIATPLAMVLDWLNEQPFGRPA